MVDGKEKFRANTWARCHRFITWHHQDSTLNEPLPTQTETSHTTENRVMAHIFNECQNYGFEILNDGIYKDGVKLGQVGCTDGNWWVIQGSSGQQQYSDSVFDAVRSLNQFAIRKSQFAIEITTNGFVDEHLQYQPLEHLTTEELQQLLCAEVADCEQLLDLPVDELTSEDWKRLQVYEPHLEPVAA
jgi:hypothetical protein